MKLVHPNEVQAISCLGYNPKLCVLKTLIMILYFKSLELMQHLRGFYVIDYVMGTMIVVGTHMVVYNNVILTISMI